MVFRVGPLILLALLVVGCARGGADRLISADRILADISYLSSDHFKGRACRSPEAQEAAAFIAARFAKAGLEPVAGGDGFFHGTADESMAPNVLGMRRGSGDEFVLISAHYDHLPLKSDGEDRIYNGADDNASGTAAVLAIADAMQQARMRTDASIIFIAFTGEEAGLRGSRFLAGKPPFALARVRGMFNMDMISRGEPDLIFVDGGKEAGPLRDLLANENRRLKIGLRLVMGTHPDWLARSDQGPFIRRKVPAVLLSVEDHADYHEVTDTADRVLPELAKRVTRLVMAAAITLAAEQRLARRAAAAAGLKWDVWLL